MGPPPASYPLHDRQCGGSRCGQQNGREKSGKTKQKSLSEPMRGVLLPFRLIGCLVRCRCRNGIAHAHVLCTCRDYPCLEEYNTQRPGVVRRMRWVRISIRTVSSFPRACSCSVSLNNSKLCSLRLTLQHRVDKGH